MARTPANALPHRPRRVQVSLPNGPLWLWMPAGTEALLEALVDAPPDPDDKMPYWADLWASAIALAELIDEGQIPTAGRTALELGAGLGLVSLTAARAGARVRASDWDEDALHYVAASAAENGLTVETTPLDWRSPRRSDAADVVFAADVLYEARNVPDVARALATLTRDEAWLADPGREHLPAFVKAARASFAHLEREVRCPDKPPSTIQILKMVFPKT